MLYVAGGEGCGTHITKAETGPADFGGTWKPRDRFVGGGTVPTDFQPANPAWKLEQHGGLSQIDVVTGKVVKKVQLAYFNRAGMLATAGNWVATGECDGNVRAFNAQTMEEVWKFNVGSCIKAPPMTFSVGGKQYVGIMVGALPAAAETKVNPELTNFTATHMLVVFSL